MLGRENEHTHRLKRATTAKNANLQHDARSRSPSHSEKNGWLSSTYFLKYDKKNRKEKPLAAAAAAAAARNSETSNISSVALRRCMERASLGERLAPSNLGRSCAIAASTKRGQRQGDKQARRKGNTKDIHLYYLQPPTPPRQNARARGPKTSHISQQQKSPKPSNDQSLIYSPKTT